MITCSKCATKFDFEWRNISKDSTIPCPNCGNECLVKLFDLQNHTINEDSGFAGVAKSYEEIKSEEEKESKSLHDHLLIITVILNILVGLFLLGMYNIDYLEDKAPQIAKLYNMINIAAHKTIAVSSYKIDKKDSVLTVILDLKNLGDTPEILSDVQILIRDVFNNTTAASHVKPNKIVRSGETFNLKINVAGVDQNARKIDIFINGKISLEDKIDI